MFQSRIFVVLMAILALLPAAVPAVAALPAAASQLPEPLLDAVQDTYNATCAAGFGGTCAALNDTEGAPSPEAIVDGACVDAAARGIDCEPPAPPVDEAPKLVALAITQPAAYAGARPGSEVTITWTSSVIDPLNRGVAFAAQVRSLSSAGDWKTVPGYQCTASPESATGLDSGTCQTKWTPGTVGSYAIRVLFLPSPVGETLCSLGQNCDMIAPFYVDSVAPAVTKPCVVLTSGCAPAGTTLSTSVLAVTAGATDETALANVTITASGPLGVTSCDLPAANVRGQATVEEGISTCSLNLTTILPATSSGVYAGNLTVTATARDAAGNAFTSAGVSHRVDTATGDGVQTQLIGSLPALVQNDRSMTLSYKVVYTSPPHRVGQPAGNLPFTVSTPAGTVCSGTTTPLGQFDCPVANRDAVRTYTAAATPSESLASTPTVDTLTWTSIAVQRVQAEDQPRTTAYANANTTYQPAFRLAFTHNQEPAAAILSSLTAPNFTPSFAHSDTAGLVRVPQISVPSAIANFTADFTISEVAARSFTGNITWTAIVVSNVTFDRPLANAGDMVNLTAKAVYENNPGRLVEGARLKFESLPNDCTPGIAAIRAGVLTVSLTCTGIHDRTAFPVVISQASADGITAIRQNLAFVANWTSISVSSPAYSTTFTNVSDSVRYTATATYTHNGSLVPNATLSGLSLPSGCAGSGAVYHGALNITATCSTSGQHHLHFVVTSAHANVRLLKASTVPLQATWTRVVFSDLTVNDTMVNVDSPVRVMGTLTYEHDGSAVPGATLSLAGAGASSDCAVVSGGVANGVVNATIACARVANFSETAMPVTLGTTTNNVTSHVAAGQLKATWTRIAFSGIAIDRTFVNVSDTIRLTGVATYAHDNTSVPSATLAAPALPDGCALGTRSIVGGAVTVTASCTNVTDLTSGALLVVEAETNGITLTNPVHLNATWTRIRVNASAVSDALVNTGDVVFLNGTAVYEHNGAPVRTGTLGIDPARVPSGCTLEAGTITNGTLRSSVRCTEVANLSAAGVPLVVTSTDSGIVNLTQPLSVKSIWTRVNVTYTRVTTAATLNANASAPLVVTLTYAHDGSPVVNGHVSVTSGTPGNTTVSTCTTAGDVLPGTPGECRVNLRKSLGNHTFSVTGASMSKTGSGFARDVTVMNNTPAPVTYRWSAIAFTGFLCQVEGSEAVPCAGRTFRNGTAVTVTATAVAADTGERLAGAQVVVNGYNLLTDAQGRASIPSFTGFAGESKSIFAEGESAWIGSDKITASFHREETIAFS